MGFVDAIKSGFNNYVGFTGRARRSEFWFFYLFNLIVMMVAGVIDNAIFGEPSILYLLAVLALLLPNLAMAFRRLHDTGRSAWWLLIALIPLVGAIVLLIFYILDSEPGANKHGPNPKGVDAAPAAAEG